MDKKTIITGSAEETQQLAADFVAEVLDKSAVLEKTVKRGKSGNDKTNQAKKGATVICLKGDLGSGKTTFSQGLAKALGVEEIVNSPTFLIMKKYPLTKKRKNLYHIDCYRMRDAEEIIDLGWDEIISDEKNIVLIEWPEKIMGILPKDRIEIRFSVVDYYERKVEFM